MDGFYSKSPLAEMVGRTMNILYAGYPSRYGRARSLLTYASAAHRLDSAPDSDKGYNTPYAKPQQSPLGVKVSCSDILALQLRQSNRQRKDC